jgi:hypothetical protein
VISYAQKISLWNRGTTPATDEAPDCFSRWFAEVGLIAFALWLSWRTDYLNELNRADPTGITQAMVVLWLAGLAWCGLRAWRIDQEIARSMGTPLAGWSQLYVDARTRASNDTDRAALIDVLSERAQGVHETAWWLNGLLLKLGLLGTVVGFIIMTLNVSASTTFDASQAQVILKAMTRGMGVALYTTLVGLIGNIVLGWQLHRLDRAADWLVSHTVERAATQ